jgi:hypothetical protein
VAPKISLGKGVESCLIGVAGPKAENNRMALRGGGTERGGWERPVSLRGGSVGWMVRGGRVKRGSAIRRSHWAGRLPTFRQHFLRPYGRERGGETTIRPGNGRK